MPRKKTRQSFIRINQRQANYLQLLIFVRTYYIQRIAKYVETLIPGALFAL